MISRWGKGTCWTSIAIPDAVLKRRYEGYLATLMRGLFVLSALKKNSLQNMRHGAQKLLRQENSAGSGHVVRRRPCLPRSGRATCSVSPVWRSEARGAGVVIGQPFLHQEVCVLCGPEVSGDDYFRCSKGVEARLAHSEGIGQIPLCDPSMVLQAKQLRHPLKERSYKCTNSVSAPFEAAPSSAFVSRVAVFQFFLGLPLIPMTIISQCLFYGCRTMFI
jgi:hypothetical protein